MCIGVPLQILSVDGIVARATDGTEESLLDLEAVPWQREDHRKR